VVLFNTRYIDLAVNVLHRGLIRTGYGNAVTGRLVVLGRLNLDPVLFAGVRAPCGSPVRR